jgi:hypothetical protein
MTAAPTTAFINGDFINPPMGILESSISDSATPTPAGCNIVANWVRGSYPQQSEYVGLRLGTNEVDRCLFTV